MLCKKAKNRILCFAAAAVIIMTAAFAGCSARKGGSEAQTGTSASSSLLTSSATDVTEEEGEPELYIPEHMVTKYASLAYDSRMQEAYDNVVNTLTTFSEESFVPLTISTADYVRVLETVRCEQLMLFFLENRSYDDFYISSLSYKMNFTYKYSIEEANEMLRATEKAAQEIIAQTYDGMSDYEKLKFFHDYLVINVESSVDDQYADSIYGALVNKKALCEGYAKAFSYLCNLSGIENMIVTGYTGVDHMWNMVKLEGSWYHVDIGWDKPAAAISEQFPELVLYQYFLVDDSVIENNRQINNYLCVPPKAEVDTYNYFIHEGKYAYSYDEALGIIEDSCRDCIDSGENWFMLKLDSSNLCLQTTGNLTKPDANGVTDIEKIVEKLNFKGQISYINYYSQYRILIFVLEN